MDSTTPIPTTLDLFPTHDAPAPDASSFPVPPPPTHLLAPQNVPPPQTPAEALAASITDAVADTLHKIDPRAHLEMLARTDPRTFRMWVEMCLPKQSRGEGTRVQVNNVISALPKSPLDGLPPGFDIHR